jgi:hypothetical protein
MSVRRPHQRMLLSSIVLLAVLCWPTPVSADDPPSFDFTTPVFGLAAAPDGGLLVADSGAGVIELRRGAGGVVAELPFVTDVAPIGRGTMWAVTSPPDGWLYRVSRSGTPRRIADISGFEANVNPDGGVIESNPFDLARLGGGRVLVADAAANAVLIANRRGGVDWVATLPVEFVSTENVKSLAGCPDAPDEFAFVCDLPAEIPAEAVATSVAVGPDGAYYVSELKGFPAPVGESKVWRIAPGTRHADCGSSSACSVVADDFTSIIDITFGPDGTLHVVELDEASWLALELGFGTGGSVNACTWGSFACDVEAGDLPIPMAAAVTKSGRVFAAILALVPGEARVIAI